MLKRALEYIAIAACWLGIFGMAYVKTPSPQWEKGKWPIPGMAVLAIMYLKKTNQKSSSTNPEKPLARSCTPKPPP
jgi:hypothetical protein